MSYSPSASQEYLKNAVLTAPPEQLQLMLYDGAIRFANQGLDALRAKNYDAMFNALDRAQRIVLELSNGLRPDVNPELAQQVAALYSFIYHRLVDATVHQDEQAIQDALRILGHQRETWLLVLDKLAQEQKSQRPTPTPAPSAQATPGNDPPPTLDAEG